MSFWKWFNRWIWRPLGHLFRLRSLLDLLWPSFGKGLVVILSVGAITAWAAVYQYPWPLLTVIALALIALTRYLFRAHSPQISESESTLRMDGLCTGEWSSDEFERPVVVTVRQQQMPVPTGARNTTARIQFVHADGTTFTVTQATWIVQKFEGIHEISKSIRASVDLEPDEDQTFVFLIQRKNNRSWWAYGGTLNIPAGVLHQGEWEAQCSLVSDTTTPLTRAIRFSVHRDNVIRWGNPAIVPLSLKRAAGR